MCENFQRVLLTFLLTNIMVTHFLLRINYCRDFTFFLLKLLPHHSPSNLHFNPNPENWSLLISILTLDIKALKVKCESLAYIKCLFLGTSEENVTPIFVFPKS